MKGTDRRTCSSAVVRPPTCVTPTPRPTDASHLASAKLQHVVFVFRCLCDVLVLGTAKYKRRFFPYTSMRASNSSGPQVPNALLWAANDRGRGVCTSWLPPIGYRRLEPKWQCRKVCEACGRAVTTCTKRGYMTRIIHTRFNKFYVFVVNSNVFFFFKVLVWAFPREHRLFYNGVFAIWWFVVYMVAILCLFVACLLDQVF